MAKKVFLIRHAKAEFDPARPDVWQFNSRLIPPAEEQIKRAADHFAHRGIVFSAMRHSPLVRAGQTCERLAVLMRISVESKVNEKLGPGKPERWDYLYNEWKQKLPDPTNVPNLGGPECLVLWPELCQYDGERTFGAVVEIARELENGQTAAAFTHNPFVRLAEFVVTGLCKPDVKNCEAVCYTFDRRSRFVGCIDYLFQP